jgi:hypothetical protein
MLIWLKRWHRTVFLFALTTGLIANFSTLLGHPRSFGPAHCWIAGAAIFIAMAILPWLAGWERRRRVANRVDASAERIGDRLRRGPWVA